MRLLMMATGFLLFHAALGQSLGYHSSSTKVTIQTPPVPDASKQQITTLQKAYVSAKAALGKHPHSQTAKQAFAVAADRYATAAMTTTSMTPHQRYPLALRLYREVLKVEPKNHEAANNSQMIIDVYKSMHRPIPN